MAENSKPRPKKPQRQRRALQLEFQECVVGITGWDWSYSFSLDKTPYRAAPYHEYRHLVIKGTLLKPTGLKTDKVEVTLLPDNNLGEERRKGHEPISVGTLELHDNKMVLAHERK